MVFEVLKFHSIDYEIVSSYIDIDSSSSKKISSKEESKTPTLDMFSRDVTELAKTPGLGEAKAKKIKKMLQNKNKNFKKSGQKTLHES